MNHKRNQACANVHWLQKSYQPELNARLKGLNRLENLVHGISFNEGATPFDAGTSFESQVDLAFGSADNFGSAAIFRFGKRKWQRPQAKLKQVNLDEPDQVLALV